MPVDSTATSGSITQRLKKLKGDDSSAAQQACHDIYERHFDWLAGVARRALQGVPRGAVDEEDVVQSGLMAFFRGARKGQFPDLTNRKNLWRLLMTIIERKAINQRHQQLAQKRGRGRVRGGSAFIHQDSGGGGGMAPAAPGPLPVTTAEVREHFTHLFQLLEDDTLRSVAVMKLQRHTNAEIAQKLGVVERTVERKLNRIRRQWSELLVGTSRSSGDPISSSIEGTAG
jgi:RNA polymerase sigma factor (sigma-70 family)